MPFKSRAQRVGFFGTRNGRSGKGIREYMLEHTLGDSGSPIRPKTGIKVPRLEIKKLKEEKVTDSLGIGPSFLHYGHSNEKTYTYE